MKLAEDLIDRVIGIQATNEAAEDDFAKAVDTIKKLKNDVPAPMKKYVSDALALLGKVSFD